MSTTNSVSVNPMSSLASQLFQRVDANSDGRLSATEFQTFLEGLLNRVGSGQTSGLGSAATAVRTAAENAAKVYQPMLGFDYVKLNTPSHTTPKYVFARASQDVSLPWDRASRSAGLSQIADYIKANGYPNVKVIGDDKLNFGDGFGDIDVLTGDGQWWWGA